MVPTHRPAPPRPGPFFDNPFEPVHEETTAFDLPVVGRIPASLDGRYLRNGAKFLEGIRLRDGRAEWYLNHSVRSRAVTDALVEKGWTDLLPPQLGVELDTVDVGDAFAAHTKLDLASGELHAIGALRGSRDLHHIVVDGSGRLSGATPIELAGRPLVHDFALTGRHVVLFALPARPAHLAVWRRDDPAATVRWFPVEAGFVLHTLNAYDDGATIVIDVVRRESGAAAAGSLHRWTVDLDGGRVHERTLCDRPLEYPRVDERRVGRPHRFGYSAAIDEAVRGLHAPCRARALLKHDLADGSVEVHDFGPDLVAGEPLFVPAAADAAEDDGHVLTFLSGRGGAPGELAILAARDFGGEPVARVLLPARVPLGLHGRWMAGAR